VHLGLVDRWEELERVGLLAQWVVRVLLEWRDLLEHRGHQVHPVRQEVVARLGWQVLQVPRGELVRQDPLEHLGLPERQGPRDLRVLREVPDQLEGLGRQDQRDPMGPPDQREPRDLPVRQEILEQPDLWDYLERLGPTAAQGSLELLGLQAPVDRPDPLVPPDLPDPRDSPDPPDLTASRATRERPGQVELRGQPVHRALRGLQGRAVLRVTLVQQG